MDENPWKVESIYDFSCLKCPECNFYNKEETFFKEHAIGNHPLSFVLFGKRCEEKFDENLISRDCSKNTISQNQKDPLKV